MEKSQTTRPKPSSWSDCNNMSPQRNRQEVITVTDYKYYNMVQLSQNLFSPGINKLFWLTDWYLWWISPQSTIEQMDFSQAVYCETAVPQINAFCFLSWSFEQSMLQLSYWTQSLRITGSQGASLTFSNQTLVTFVDVWIQMNENSTSLSFECPADGGEASWYNWWIIITLRIKTKAALETHRREWNGERNTENKCGAVITQRERSRRLGGFL